MKRRAIARFSITSLALAMVLVSSLRVVAGEVPVTQCGQYFSHDDDGYLTGDLDCSAYTDNYFAVHLGTGRSLDLRGFTIKVPAGNDSNYGVRCFDDCWVHDGTIDGGGGFLNVGVGGRCCGPNLGETRVSNVTIFGVGQGVSGSQVRARDCVLTGNGTGIHAGVEVYGRADVRNCDISNFSNGIGSIRAKVRGSNIHDNFEGGVLGYAGDGGGVKLKNTNVTNNGADATLNPQMQINQTGGGVSSKRVVAKNVTITGNATFGVQAFGKASVEDSNVTNNLVNAGCNSSVLCADIWSAGSPTANSTLCGLSLDMNFPECLADPLAPGCPVTDPTGHTWGVCSND